MGVTCSGITRAGSRCSRPTLAGKQHCLMHDPESSGLRREAASRGGRNRSAKARAAKTLPETLTTTELAAWLSAAFKSTLTGRLEPRVATACATIARTLLEIRTQTELEQRLEALEQQVSTTTDRRWRA